MLTINKTCVSKAGICLFAQNNVKLKHYEMHTPDYECRILRGG